MMEHVTHLLALLTILALAFGIPSIVVEWMRQRQRMQEQLAELQAWREALQRSSDEHARVYQESVQLQREAYAQAKLQHDAYLRGVALQEATVRIAEARLEEARKANQLLDALTSAVRDRSGQ